MTTDEKIDLLFERITALEEEISEMWTLLRHWRSKREQVGRNCPRDLFRGMARSRVRVRDLM